MLLDSTRKDFVEKNIVVFRNGLRTFPSSKYKTST